MKGGSKKSDRITNSKSKKASVAISLAGAVLKLAAKHCELWLANTLNLGNNGAR